MRTRLLHNIADRRPPRRRSRGAEPAQVEVVAESTTDPAVQRVREAGGPVDHACYTCSCGYVFAAAVSTTVTCAHCGSRQAW